MIEIIKKINKKIVNGFKYLIYILKKLFSFKKKESTDNKKIAELQILIKQSEEFLNKTVESKTNNNLLTIKNNERSHKEELTEAERDLDIKIPSNHKEKKYIFYKIFIFIFLVFSIYLTYCLWDLPDYHSLSDYEPPLTTRIYSTDGYIISEFAKEKRSFININDIPPIIKEAFIAAEDKNFYHHYGFDILGLVRSIYNDVLYIFGESGNFAGASTITQQVAKTFLLSNDRTIKRKIREAVLTIKIENAFNKDHILELYLNEIYLGRGSYGVASAALNYFAKPIGDLTIAEASYLAAIPKAPSRYDPRFNYDRALARRNYVLGRLLEDGKINQAQEDEALNEPIDVSERIDLRTVKSDYAAEEVRKDLMDRFGYEDLYNGGLIVKTTINYNYQEYAYDALRAGIILYDNSLGYRGPVARLFSDITDENILELNKEDLNGNTKWLNLLRNQPEVLVLKDTVHPWDTVMVTQVTKNKLKIGYLDGKTSEISLENTLWARPYPHKNKNKTLGNFSEILQPGDIILVETVEDKVLLRQVPEINGAIVAMDPQSGDILSMQGGFSFLLSQFNRATQAKRQPGSSFKPFVYLAAIHKGFTPADLFLDAPYVAESENEEAWKPRNYLSAYNGYITLRYALEFSKNLATIRVANATGLDNISYIAKKLGIYDDNVNNLSEVLGSKETTLLKMVTAYSSLVNGGKKIDPNLVNLVQDKTGKVIYKRDKRDCLDCSNVVWRDQPLPVIQDTREQILDPKDAYIIVNMLQGVVERGSGKKARIPGYNLGGKTGTTNEVKDAWFIGFSPDVVVGIYMGSDTPKSLGNTLSGSTIALPIFAQFMQNALRNKEALPFRTPEGIVMSWVNYKTGEPSTPGPGVILESFKKGQEKSKVVDSTALTDLDGEGIY